MIKSEIIDRLRPKTAEEKRILKESGGIDKSLYMDNNDDVINSRKLLSQGKLITVRPHTRFVRFPEHTHDYVEVIYMCSGSTTHIVNGDRIVLGEGELLFLSQNARQKVLPAGENDIAVNFIILPEFFDGPLQMMGNEESLLRRFVTGCLKNDGNSAGYLHFAVRDVLPVQNLVENLLWVLINGVPNKRRINQLTMGLLFIQLMNCTDRLVCKSRGDVLVLQVLGYIEDNYKTGSLAECATKLHYDFSWLSREIKRKTGRTYTDFLQDRRMAQAAFLLANTDMNIAEIAASAGYENVSFFHRLFREKCGVTPAAYRKQKQDNKVK